MYCHQVFAILISLITIPLIKCDGRIGPDPWDYVSNENSVKHDDDIPPDLRIVPPKKVQMNNVGTGGVGEWFYKRILAIVLKGGKIEKSDDGSVEISLQMRYSLEQWELLNGYLTSNNILSEDMFRRSLGYVEEAICKPTITEKIVMAWTEYIQLYLIEYKTLIIWTFTILSGIGGVFWLWHHMSHKHVIILVLIGLYAYEVFVSYKEAEKQELERFITAMNTCKWFFWSSTCEVPPPDVLIFLKHMNPLKIGIRMFSTLLSEPMITMSEAVQIVLHGITDGLWFPFNKIVYGFLIIIFSVLIIFLLVMIIFNYILNIPFSLSFLGIVSVGFKQRNRSSTRTCSNDTVTRSRIENTDRISGETLFRFLDVCSRALTVQSTQPAQVLPSRPSRNSELSLTYRRNIPRSASTSRLPTSLSGEA